ncbi:MAG: hypothetical protein F6J87_09595 [Spirulina sp. SIO3F2]|nr:hypothetical protein [Spirulina sp. SIO3F2]
MVKLRVKLNPEIARDQALPGNAGGGGSASHHSEICCDPEAAESHMMHVTA